MRNPLRAATLVLASALALAFGSTSAEAQKALVYCPTADPSGCPIIKTALGPAFPGGVDAAYDGSNGTVDLASVDLFQYSVFIVPSLAETDSAAPYDKLRDPAIAARLKAALIGRRAFWSGTPDQGVTANRAQKDALLTNLAAWASADFATVNAPGLVVLQDHSDLTTQRYSWVQPILGFNIIADPKLVTYSAVSSLTATGNAVLNAGGSTLAYTNMASFGFQVPSGGAGLSMDAVGKTGTTVGGQVVLITQSGANTGGAVVTTDKDDYAPGMPVIITGTGFGANETVSLLLHEDPTIEPDFSFTTTTDASGRFVFNGFTPDTLDTDVRFILKATGQSSGRVAQTTFTDGIQNTGTLAFFTVTGGTTCTSTSVTTSVAGTALCAKVTINTNNGNTSGNTAQFLWFRQGESSPAFTTSTGTIPASATFVATSIQTPDVAGTWTVKLCDPTTACSNTNNTLSSGTISITAGTVATSLTLSAPTPANVAFGSNGPVSVSATLTTTSGSAPVNGATVAFTVDGGSIGSATTNASGVATISNYSPAALGVGSHTIVASFAQATLGGTTYLQSTSGNQALSVGQANQTIAFGSIPDKTFGDADFTVSATATSGLTVSFTASGSCSINASNTVSLTGAGSCTITASQAGNTNFAAATPVQQSFQIGKANVTLALSGLTATYDGTPKPVTVTTTPASIAGVSVTYDGGTTVPTNAGSYAVVASLTNTNYMATPVNGTLVVARATPAFSNLSAPPVSYKATSATISGTLTAGTKAASGSVNVTVAGTGGALTASAAIDATTGNFSATIDPSTLPANLTGYQVTLSTPQTQNFEAASDNSLKLVVNKASQTITFGALGGKTFGDAPFTVSATTTSPLTVSFSASGGACSVTGTTVTITGAGSCTITAEQAGDNNYDAATSVPQTFSVAKAKATVSVTGATVTYDGAQHGATGTATGIGGADLSSSLELGQKFTNVPGGTASWTFTGGANYENDNGTATITINQAAGSIALSGPATIVYKSTSPITTNSVGDGAITYAATTGAGSVCTVNSSTGAVTMNTGTGDCGVTATLAAGTNYTGATSAQLTIKAAKATATITVTGYTGVYDGQPHGATGTAVGVGNEDLASLLNLGASFTDVPGGTANWSFAGGANYVDANGTASIVISKAPQTTAVTISAPASMTYGQAPATLTASGGDGNGAYQFSVGASTGCSVTGDKMSVVNASQTCLVSAIRLGDNNHLDSPASSAATVTLVKANAVIAVTGFSGEYDAQPHGATGTATGAKSEDLTSLLILGASFTPVPGGTANWSFSGGDNHNPANGTAAVTITRKKASVTPAAASKVFGENDPPLTGTLSGFIASDGVSATYSRAAGEDVVGSPYLITAQLSPSEVLGNYEITANTAPFTIKPATPTITVSGGTYDYDGNAHPATGSVTGVANATLGAPTFTYSKNGGAFTADVPTGAGSYDVRANFTGGGNYGPAVQQTTTITIKALTVTASITASGKPYDGNTSVIGAVGCSLTGVISADAAMTGCTASGASFDVADAGNHTVTATVALSGTSADNYALAAGSASVGAVIAPATTTTTVTVSGATYDAQPHGATASVTGPAGLNQSLTLSYAGTGTTSYGPSTTPPMAAGSYAASASYTPTNNYQASSDVKSFTIAQRPISVQPSVTNAAALVWTGSPLTPIYSLSIVGGSLASTEVITVLGSTSFTPLTVTSVGTYPSTVSGLTNANYTISLVAGTVVVLDESKPAGAITELNPVPVGVGATLKATFSDLAAGSSNIVAWRYRLDQNAWTNFTVGSPAPSVNVVTTLPVSTSTDVIQVCVQGQDAAGNWSEESCALLAVYDPSAGFVTGGGWIDSPAGAYLTDPSLKGKANFGFVSKYQKGANVPSGNTEFQFKEGNLNFKSTSFSWLVIQGGTMAQFKGTGTINGTGSYNFLVTAIDGDQFSGTKKPDSFRIKITQGSAVVYDNQISASETSDAATVLGGGSIQIQAK
ncbi:MAG: MBG domain-containing protein [Gemmatimonadaceae bacterium]